MGGGQDSSEDRRNIEDYRLGSALFRLCQSQVRPSEVSSLKEILADSHRSKALVAGMKAEMGQPRYLDPELQEIESDQLETGNSAIPQRVFELLPETLKTATDFFDTWYEKDVFLLAIIGTLSAALPNVRFLYGHVYHSPHLFFFIVAPAASGKGSAQHAFHWLDKIDQKLIEESRYELDLWLEAVEERQKSKKSKESKKSNGVLFLDASPQPKERAIRAGGNITSAALCCRLDANEEGVFIGSTEGDALSSSNRSEHGHFSHVLRAAFHHESVMVDRKGDGALRIKYPRLALVLSGTPDQFPRLIEGGIEDGLYSRFGVYRFKAPAKYISQRPGAMDETLQTFTENSAKKALHLYEMLASRNSPLYFDVSKEQWDRADAEYEALHDHLAVLSKDQLLPTVRRGVLTAFRISSVIAVWRCFDSGDDLTLKSSIQATDDDMEAGLLLGLLLTEHSILEALRIRPSLGDLDKAQLKGSGCMTGDQRAFYDALPNAFSTSEAKTIAEDQEVPNSTFYHWLNRFVEMGILEKPQHGEYAKPRAQEPSVGLFGLSGLSPDRPPKRVI